MKNWFCLLAVLLCLSCSNKPSGKKDAAGATTYTNPLLPTGIDPSATFHNGKYYYMQCLPDQSKIVIWETVDITDLEHAVTKDVWIPDSSSYSSHIWGPELHFINDKWYLYFAADDGNMDNHEIYVLENSSADPMTGTFVMKGAIKTNDEWNWGIHATTFLHRGVQYLLWSGWPKRRINAETQCIYIASMANPWTLQSSRILISKPEYEWERQWINPDGTRTAYPIYVNEAPQYFHSKDYGKVLVYYSASGCWTPYNSMGMLVADADSDLLNPASWIKSQTPVFSQSPENGVYGPGGSSFVPSPDGTEFYIIYHARNIPNSDGGPEIRSPRMQKIEWDSAGLPVLGTPVREGVPLPKPSGAPVKE